MSHLVASLDGVNYVTEAVDDHDGLAFGEAFVASGTYLAVIDLSTGKVTNLASIASQGISWMSFADGWLAWPQSGGGGSSIQLWNPRTRERRTIATAGPADGVVGQGHVSWIEPAGDQVSALRAYDLSSGKTTSLDSGRLGAPVLAGGHLVWTKTLPGSDQPSFVFADASTLEPQTVPAELRAVRGVIELAGSAQRLVWLSAAGGTQWFVDNLAAGVIRTYTAPGHYLQFPELADPYLVWLGPGGDSVVDLGSGVGFDLPLPGGLLAGGDTIVVERGSTIKGKDRTDVAVLHPSKLSPLGPCHG